MGTARRYNTLLEICADNNDYDRGCQVGGKPHRTVPIFRWQKYEAEMYPCAAQLIDRMEEEAVEPNNWTTNAVSSRKSLRHYLRRKFPSI